MPIDIYNDPHAEKRGDILRRAGAPLFPNSDTKTVKPGRALYLTADASVVEQGDPEAELLLCGEQGTLPADLAHELGISGEEKTVKESAEEAAEEKKPEETHAGLTIHATPAPAETGAPAQTAAPEQPETPAEIVNTTSQTGTSFGGGKGKK